MSIWTSEDTPSKWALQEARILCCCMIDSSTILWPLEGTQRASDTEKPTARQGSESVSKIKSEDLAHSRDASPLNKRKWKLYVLSPAGLDHLQTPLLNAAKCIRGVQKTKRWYNSMEHKMSWTSFRWNFRIKVKPEHHNCLFKNIPERRTSYSAKKTPRKTITIAARIRLVK